MEDNLTLEEEEIVHENAVLPSPFKNRIAETIFTIISATVIIGLPILSHLTS